MGNQTKALSVVLKLSGFQSGVATARQCMDAGLDRRHLSRLLDSGQWQRLSRGVFLTRPGVAPLESLAWAGVLIGGEGSVVAGTTAAILHGMELAEPDTIIIKVPPTCHPRDRGAWHFVRPRQLPRGRGALPREDIETTILDLVAAEPREAENLVLDAVRSRLTTRRRLSRALSERARHPHRTLLERLLTEDEEGFESVLERDWHALVERPHGLPRGIRQERAGGTRRDLRYGKRLLVELDGRRGHEGRGRFRDMERDNHNQLLGFTTLRFGWSDCHHRPCESAAQIGRMLALMGVGDAWHPCPNCVMAMAS